jgi:hypothetical protein
MGTGDRGWGWGRGDRGWGQGTEDGMGQGWGQGTGDRGQRTGDRGQRTRMGQRTGDRGQRRDCPGASVHRCWKCLGPRPPPPTAGASVHPSIQSSGRGQSQDGPDGPQSPDPRDKGRGREDSVRVSPALGRVTLEAVTWRPRASVSLLPHALLLGSRSAMRPAACDSLGDTR